MIITVILSVISSYLIYHANYFEFHTISLIICCVIFCITQYGLIIHSFTAFWDDMSISLYILFLIWIIIYSLLFLCNIIIAIIFTYIQDAQQEIATTTFIIFLFLIALFASVIQLILITSGECDGHLMSMSESILLLISILLSVCVISAVFINNDYLKGVLCVQIILIIFQYIIIINSMNTWMKSEIYCNNFETLLLIS